MRWDAALDKRQMVDGKPGATLREHYEAAVRRKHPSPEAVKALEPPCEYPECLAYLHGWSLELLGRSGVGMSGYAPLSYAELVSWALLTGRQVTPAEVDALMALDAVLRHPEPPEETD